MTCGPVPLCTNRAYEVREGEQGVVSAITVMESVSPVSTMARLTMESCRQPVLRGAEAFAFTWNAVARVMRN